jgi:micrococcal nuclease
MKKLIILIIISMMLFVTVFSLSEDIENNQANIKITRVHYISKDEFIEFINEGVEPVNMKGMMLISGGKGETYIFDDLVLEPLELIRLHSGPEASGLVWTYDYVHFDITDLVVLSDKNGKYVSFCRWGR